jgi:hypothetical protein
MNSELNTTVNSAAERQMMADWTSSLLRLRSRPMRLSARSQQRFAANPTLDSLTALHRLAPQILPGE